MTPIHSLLQGAHSSSMPNVWMALESFRQTQSVNKQQEIPWESNGGTKGPYVLHQCGKYIYIFKENSIRQGAAWTKQCCTCMLWTQTGTAKGYGSHPFSGWALWNQQFTNKQAKVWWRIRTSETLLDSSHLPGALWGRRQRWNEIDPS